MEAISPEAIISEKILTYNLYDENKNLILAAGEILTPGKVLQIRNFDVLYREELKIGTVAAEKKPKKTTGFKMESKADEFGQEELLDYSEPINKLSKIDVITQVELKSMYGKIIKVLDSGVNLDDLPRMYNQLKDKLVAEVLHVLDTVVYGSQMKLIGDFDKCHALNTAIFSIMLAKKLEFEDYKILDIALAALLHDIGKSKIPLEILNNPSPTPEETRYIQAHTVLGYKMLKQELGFSEDIAKVALNHHEWCDGNGYPRKISEQNIDMESRIVGLCSYFDKLTSGKTEYNITKTKDAMKVLLNIGAKRFSAQVSYTFVYMFNYGDVLDIKDVGL